MAGMQDPFKILLGFGFPLVFSAACYYDSTKGCFDNAVSGLRNSAFASQVGLSVLDSRLGLLEKAVGSGYSGAASATLADARENYLLIKTGSRSGRGLAFAFLSASDSTVAAWNSVKPKSIGLFNWYVCSTPGSAPDATSFVSAYSALAGRSSLLAKEIELARRCDSAVESLEGERRDSTLYFDARLADVGRLEMRWEAEKISLVLPSDLVSSSSDVSAITSLEGSLFFGDAFKEAKAWLSAAKELRKQADQTYSANNSGYLGDSIVLLEVASDLLEKAESKMDYVDYSSTRAASDVCDAMLERREAAAEAIGSAANALAASNAAALLYSQEALLREAQSKATVGERVSACAARISALDEVIGIASVADAGMLEQRVRSRARELAELAGRVQADGLDSSYARLAAEAVLYALDQNPISSEESLWKLEGVLVQKKAVLLASVEARYGNLVGKWIALNGLSEFFSSASLKQLGAYAPFFAGGVLNSEKASGRLAEAGVFLDRLFEDVEARKPQLLRQHFADSAGKEFSLGSMQLDGVTKGYLRVWWTNDLPFSFEGTVEAPVAGLELLEKARSVKVVEASGGVEYSGGRFFISNARYGARYSALLEFEGVFCISQSRSESTEWADQHSARKKLSVAFDCDVSGTASFSYEIKGGLSELSALGGATAYTAPEGIYVVAPVSKGRNAVSVFFVLSEPIEVSQSYRNTGTQLVFEYYLRPKVSLEKAVVRLSTRLDCATPLSASGVRVYSDLKASSTVAPGVFSVSLEGGFNKGHVKDVRVTVDCVTAAFPQDLEAGLVQTALAVSPAPSQVVLVAPASDPGLEEKKKIITEDYPLEREAAENAREACEKAFGDADGVKAVDTVAAERCKQAVKEITAAIRVLDPVWAKAEGDFKKLEAYSADYLQATVNGLQNSRLKAVEAVASVKAVGFEAVSSLKELENQFGNAGTAALLEAAEQDLANGRYLAALERAEAVKQELNKGRNTVVAAGVPSSSSGMAVGGANPWLLGIAGLGVLGSLFFVFRRGGVKEFKEL